MRCDAKLAVYLHSYLALICCTSYLKNFEILYNKKLYPIHGLLILRLLLYDLSQKF